MQAAVFERHSFDLLPLFGNDLAAAKTGVGRRGVVEALVAALVVVVIDKGSDLGFKVSRQEVVFQQNAFIQCLMRMLDLALGLRMVTSPLR